MLAKAGPCRSCGSPGPIEMHHLVNRSQRGDDVPGNLVPLCLDCHRSITSRLAGWEIVAGAIRCSLTPLELAYCTAKKSRAWLERMYPAGDVTLCSRCKRPAKAQGPREAPRKRKRWVISVPDDAEDGADLLDTLIESARQDLGRADGTPAYFTLVDCLHFFLTSSKAQKAA
ncbi:MAG: HNH endonuclease [Gemmatimonadaceae bacterium]|nr:HNH endonuclease [Gemmatimonadaceae bacterium]